MLQPGIVFTMTPDFASKGQASVGGWVGDSPGSLLIMELSGHKVQGLSVDIAGSWAGSV